LSGSPFVVLVLQYVMLYCNITYCKVDKHIIPNSKIGAKKHENQ